MMSEERNKQQRVMMVTMEDLVPAEHFLRKLDAAVDMDFVYELVRAQYRAYGRPSIDPVVLIKMILLGYLYGIDSERRLEQEIQVNVAYRWYLGLDLEDRVPDHSTLSQNRRRRFKDTAVFEEIFVHIVRLCMEAGLVEGKSIAMDATHVRANADDKKRIVVTVTDTPRAYLCRLNEQIEALEADMYADKCKRGPKPKSRSGLRERKETHSATDPDSGILGRPGKPSGFHYLCHQSSDVREGIITDIHVTSGNRLDHECCTERIKIQRDRLKLPIRNMVADRGYDCVEVHHDLGEMGISLYVPRSRRHVGCRKNALPAEQFSYDQDRDIYHCPGGHTLHFSYYGCEKESVFAIYRSSAPECRNCSLREQCFAATSTIRKIKRSLNTGHMEQNRKLIGTEEYGYLQRRRRVICEGNFAYMKDNGNLRRTRKRGVRGVTEHCLLCAAALNLRKLVKAS